MTNRIIIVLGTLYLTCGLATAGRTASKSSPAKQPATKATAPPQTTKPPEPKPVAQVTVDGVTLRLLRVRWAQMKEVSDWKWPDRALTIWVDARSSDPAVRPAQGLALADYVLAAWLTGPDGRHLEGRPVGIVRSIHRPQLGYIPGEAPAGQSVWRYGGADPRWPKMRLEFEYLLPGAPYTRKTIPPSIIEPPRSRPAKPASSPSESPSPPESAPESPWLRRFIIELKADQIDRGQTTKASSPPLATAHNVALEAQLLAWTRSRATISPYPRSDDPEKTRTVYFYTAHMLLRSRDPQKKVSPWSFNLSLQDDIGREYKVTTVGSEDKAFWKPDGTPVGPDEIMMEIRGEAPAEQSLPRSFTLEIAPQSNSFYERDAQFRRIAIPPPGEAVDIKPRLDPTLPPGEEGPIVLRKVCLFDAEHPLSGAGKQESSLPTAGLAVLLKLNPRNVKNRTEVFRGTVRYDTGSESSETAASPVFKARRNLLDEAQNPTGSAASSVWHTIVFAPPADAKSFDLQVRVQEHIQDETTQPLVFRDLPVPAMPENKAPK
ncbi:MAG: hypothetical protein M3347_01095 [Armatimonadota bacterium]|nr:hypothetical protein [Armatimonadota bacterium]